MVLYGTAIDANWVPLSVRNKVAASRNTSRVDGGFIFSFIDSTSHPNFSGLYEITIGLENAENIDVNVTCFNLEF